MFSCSYFSRGEHIIVLCSWVRIFSTSFLSSPCIFPCLAREASPQFPPFFGPASLEVISSQPAALKAQGRREGWRRGGGRGRTKRGKLFGNIARLDEEEKRGGEKGSKLPSPHRGDGGGVEKPGSINPPPLLSTRVEEAEEESNNFPK